MPLDKPYANWIGGVFRADVLSDGEPVPHAEVEVEYLNHEPQIDEHRFDPEGEGRGAARFLQDAEHSCRRRGQIIIGLPKAGGGACARSTSRRHAARRQGAVASTQCCGSKRRR